MLARLFLTLTISTLLFALIYINIRALSRSGHGAADDHNAFLRILEESVVTGGVRGKGSDGAAAGVEEGFDESDNARVKELEEKIRGTADFLGELKVKLMRMTEAKSKATNADMKQSEPEEGTRQSLHEKISDLKKQSQTETKEESATTKTDLTGMNILLLYADDWTHHTLSSFHKTQPPNTILQTPTLDALSQDGIRFTHNCVTTSVCWISRATLFTGQYMSRHKTTEPCCWSGMAKPKEKLKEAPENWKELSVYELLSRNGYHVGHAGKWGVCEYSVLIECVFNA